MSTKLAPWHSVLIEQPLERGQRFDAASLRPNGELRHIDSPVGDFATVYPGLWFAELRPKLTLRKARLLPHGSKEDRELSIRQGMLGFRRHAERVETYRPDTICVSEENPTSKAFFSNFGQAEIRAVLDYILRAPANRLWTGPLAGIT